MAAPLSERLHRALVDDDQADDSGLAPEVAAAVPTNSARQIGAHTLQKVGDLVVDAKTVLPWLLAAVGAPPSLVGLLVPIRDAGSMVPQLLLAPAVRRLAVRKWVWVGGGLAQAASVLAMALVTATATGAAAGVGILATLTVFSLARAASSFAAKDVRGRTLPKGVRGQVTGLATVGTGIVAITLGLLMRTLGGRQTPPSTFAWLLVGGAAAWVVAAVVYAGIREAPGEHDRDSRRDGVLRGAVGLLAFVGAVQVEALAELTLLYPATYLLLALAHTGSRIGRKTYVVDLAEGDRRTDYIAVSNTAMGLILLAAGAVTAGVAVFGEVVALLFLAGSGILGVVVAASLPEVSAGARNA